MGKLSTAEQVKFLKDLAKVIRKFPDEYTFDSQLWLNDLWVDLGNVVSICGCCEEETDSVINAEIDKFDGDSIACIEENIGPKERDEFIEDEDVVGYMVLEGYWYEDFYEFEGCGRGRKGEIEKNYYAFNSVFDENNLWYEWNGGSILIYQIPEEQ